MDTISATPLTTTRMIIGRCLIDGRFRYWLPTFVDDEDDVPMPDISPEELAQVPVINAAWAFLEPVQAGDVAAAWTAVDPLLRRCWSQEWLHSNRSEVLANGFDREAVLAAFLQDRPNHPLWRHFVRVYQRSLNGILDGNEDPGIGAGRRPVALDIELLYLHDRSKLPGGEWLPNAYAEVNPILMRFADGSWRVLNFNSEIVPEPGWPPRLW